MHRLGQLAPAGHHMSPCADFISAVHAPPFWSSPLCFLPRRATTSSIASPLLLHSHRRMQPDPGHPSAPLSLPDPSAKPYNGSWRQSCRVQALELRPAHPSAELIPSLPLPYKWSSSRPLDLAPLFLISPRPLLLEESGRSPSSRSNSGLATAALPPVQASPPATPRAEKPSPGCAAVGRPCPILSLPPLPPEQWNRSPAVPSTSTVERRKKEKNGGDLASGTKGPTGQPVKHHLGPARQFKWRRISTKCVFLSRKRTLTEGATGPATLGPTAQQ